MSEGRWVPLPDGEMPQEGQQVRVVAMASTTGGAQLQADGFYIEETKRLLIPRNRDARIPVEVWEPTENLIPREWYRDANGRIARRVDHPLQLPWETTYGLQLTEDAMVRPLSVARWEPVQ